MPAITALADRGEPTRTRETIYNLIGSMQFPDVLLELDAASNYSEALLGHRAQSATELVALCVNADLNLTHFALGRRSKSDPAGALDVARLGAQGVARSG